MKNYQKILSEVNSGQIRPLYLLLGMEPYLIEQFKQTLIDTTLAPEELEMNLIELDLEVNTVDDLLFEAASYPFFGERKLIFVKRPEFLTSGKQKSLTDPEQKALLDYLALPSEFSTVIFLAEYEKIDRRKKVTKELQKAAVTIDFTQIKPYEADNFFKDYVKRANYQFSPEAGQLLTELTGGKLSVMLHEFDKIRIYQGETSLIERETVAHLVTKTLEHSVFELNDHVLAARPEVAIETYRELLERQEEPIKIIALLISEFRLLLQVKVLQEKRLGQQQITKLLGVHPYRVKLAFKKNQRFNKHLLEQALVYLIQTDYQMKTGQADHKLAFELFALKFADQLKNPSQNLLKSASLS